MDGNAPPPDPEDRAAGTQGVDGPAQEASGARPPPAGDAQAELEAWREKALRARADYDNLLRRTARE
ncbi:MAG TPA: hypothetical protein VHI93_01620, partial [Candidatus Thermoplasmatota archaeon]|nr:hypothetical protein [Candidatus Thermoplasmatota archaeon]